MDAATPRSSVTSIDDARRAMYRHQILAAAEYEFSQTGFTGARMGAIAKSAGVSLTTVYRHFSGKDELWDALNAERMAEFVAAVQLRADRTATPLGKILDAARAEVEFFAGHRNFLHLHLRDGLSWGTATTLIDAGRGEQREVWRTGMEMITRAAEAAVAAGEITRLRPAVVAALVISALQIWLTDWVADDCRRPVADLADEVVAHLRRCLTA
ncbi:TetR/AcrR family transcriptional regulator [Mycolicibacter minnesotensis]